MYKQNPLLTVDVSPWYVFLWRHKLP